MKTTNFLTVLLLTALFVTLVGCGGEKNSEPDAMLAPIFIQFDNASDSKSFANRDNPLMSPPSTSKSVSALRLPLFTLLH